MPRGKFDSTNQKRYPDLGSDASSICNFCARFSDVIWRGKPVVESLNVVCLLRLSNDRYCRVIRTNNLLTYLLSFSCSRSEKSESLRSIPANLHKTIAEVNESNTAANCKSNRAQTKAINNHASTHNKTLC